MPVPDAPKSGRVKVSTATRALNPRDFVRIQPLPALERREGKVLARSQTVYKSSEPSREEAFWTNYRRRQQQLTQGHFTGSGKPYQELGEILYTDAKKLTLHALGQLLLEPVKKDVQEGPPEEEDKDTTKTLFSNLWCDLFQSRPPKSAKMLTPFRQTGKELKTLSKALAHSRITECLRLEGISRDHLVQPPCSGRDTYSTWHWVASRRHITAVKQGRGYFHMLHQESLERKKALRAEQQAQDMRWRTTCQPPRYSSDEESEEEISIPTVLTEAHSQGKIVKRRRRKKMTLRSFTPVYTSVLIPNPTEAKSEHLFRQLCAIHWLLEALSLESSSSMHSILSCWNPTDPGGTKKTLEEIEEEKLTTYMWELFITDTKKFTQKARHSPLGKKIYKTVSTLGISQLSSQSPPHTQTPPDSTPSPVFCSENNVNMNIASSEVTSESAQTKEEEEALCPDERAKLIRSPVTNERLIQITHEEVSKDFYKEEDRVKKTELQGLLSAAPKDDRVNMTLIKEQESVAAGEQKARRSLTLTERKDGTATATTKEQESAKQMKKANGCRISSFIKNKSNLCADVRQKFTAVREEAASALHDTLETLERRQEERCCQKYQALKHIRYFKRDLERMRQLGMRAEREHDEDELKWFPVLLARLPEPVKNDHYVQKILKKLEKFGKNPDLRIRPDTFLKALADLQVWELCSPEIAAAVEFVRESIVQMPEEDFSEWFQTRVTSLSSQSSTF